MKPDFYFRSDKNSYQQGEKIIISGKSIYGTNKNLEGMIDILPSKINIRKKAKKFKRKFIS